MSGFPGRSGRCRSYLTFKASSIKRTVISGLVSLPLMAAMQRLRCSGVNTSVIQFEESH